MGEILRSMIFPFREALDDISQLKDRLSSLLKTNHPITKEPIPVEDESVLIENRDELLRRLRSTEIIDLLLERGVIVLDDLNEIKEEERREGRVAGVEKLLDKISFSGPRGLDAFIESLIVKGHSSLASKLLESRRTITRAEQETPHQSSANRVQESSQTITVSGPETQNVCSANTLPELLQTLTIAELTPNKYFVNRVQESRWTITRAEQETPNRPCAGGEDYNNGFEENFMKPGGKMQCCCDETLRKNHLIMMENVRVSDIIDHLFSTEVLDLNDMDKMMSKCRSEGNREAMRYLIRILFKSSHRSLPIFIECLYQTGYEEIADCLQKDMNSMKLNDVSQ